jgi:tetratricopeptide (TPR) repeat protein
MFKAMNQAGPCRHRLKKCCLLLICVAGFVLGARAEDVSFTNLLAQGELFMSSNDVPAAMKFYDQAGLLAAGNAVDLCGLSRRYCDLMYLTSSTAVQKELAARALACALLAVKAVPTNATAHATLAVCYAKNCGFADLKTELEYSRRFKLEAEQTLALDPKQDIAYYLLGRWNYGVANVGLLSWAYVKVVYGGLPQASNEEAIADFKKAIALAPDRIIHHAGLAMVYAATGERKLELVELEKCRALKPSDREDADAQSEAEMRLAAIGR